MPEPLRQCETCRHYLPYGGSIRLRETFGKCVNGKRPPYVNFAETCRGDPSLCGPEAVWWEPRAPAFEVIEEDRDLNWDDEEEEL